MIPLDIPSMLSINDAIANIKNPYQQLFTIFTKLSDLLQMRLNGLITLSYNHSTVHLHFRENLSQGPQLPQAIHHHSMKLDQFTELLGGLPNTITSVSRQALFALLGKNVPSPRSGKKGYDEFILIPMLSAGELIGYFPLEIALNTLSRSDKNYLMNVANLVAISLRNVSAYHEMRMLKEEHEANLRMNNALVTINKSDIFYARLAEEISSFIGCDNVLVSFKQKSMLISSVVSIMKQKGSQFQVVPSAKSSSVAILLAREEFEKSRENSFIELYDADFDRICLQSSHFKQMKEKCGANSVMLFKYTSTDETELLLAISRNRDTALSEAKYFLQRQELITIPGVQFTSKSNPTWDEELSFFCSLLPQLYLVLSNYHAFESINSLKAKLEEEKTFLLSEINTSQNFQEIIGKSAAIKGALLKVEQVAPIDATVLLYGETGTGKELFARAIHNLSLRKEKAFIKVNCAALPAQLIESELFGHEKGSFTGAIERRIGRFELANGGTIFLDEIGELPLDLQVKLLRVLQEREFERIGGKTTLKADVRIIAATNRDLEKEVAHNRFRADLYFRLNVFPILVPPLRERKEDIPLLIRYFLEQYSKKIGKTVTTIKKNSLDDLSNYSWPGNIRELEHMVERALILSDGETIHFTGLISASEPTDIALHTSFKTMEEMEKEHIIQALRYTKGKVMGRNSAAELLGMNGKTLGSRMRKLGIKREVQFI
ncbi:MAG: sigma 54-interacting transcriptional regulator [Ignavibacteria bacterium]|nr:sigma 54-interacting transcriptional regulator [Ignavibacteria bacterium]